MTPRFEAIEHGPLARALRTAGAFAVAAAGLAATLPLLALVSPLWIVSRVVRLAGRRYDRGLGAWSDAIEFDPELGWRARRNVRLRLADEAGEAFEVRTDADGFRGRVPLDEADAVAVGDSFAFGFSVSEGDLFADRVRDVRLKPVGAPGWSLAHMTLATEELAPRLAGKRVLWLVYVGNDLDDAVRPEMDGYRAPFARRRDGRWSIEMRHLSPEPWPFPSRIRAHEALVELGLDSHRARLVFEGCEYLLGRGAAACREAGASLGVVAIPDLSALTRSRIESALAERPEAERWDPERPDRELAAICERLDLPFLSLRPHLTERDYRVRDVHWTEGGHARVAAALEPFLAALPAPGSEEVAAGRRVAASEAGG